MMSSYAIVHIYDDVHADNVDADADADGDNADDRTRNTGHL